MVAERAESGLPRRGVLRAGAGSRGAGEGRPAPAARRGLAGRFARRPLHARGDLARRHSALAPASRAARRARKARRGRRLHRPDGPLPRHPGSAARAVRDPGRLLRRRRADEPARVRRNGHRLQLLPRRRSGRVRPRALELGGWARKPARARRPPGRGRVLGRRPRVLLPAAGREGDRRLLLRLRRQVPARVDEGVRRRAVTDASGARLRARRQRLPRRHRRRAAHRRHSVPGVPARDLGRPGQPVPHPPLARLVYASSSCRPFELAASGAAIVANPYDGIERWFEPAASCSS